MNIESNLSVGPQTVHRAQAVTSRGSTCKAYSTMPDAKRKIFKVLVGIHRNLVGPAAPITSGYDQASMM
jgi:hypothetical protein